MKQTVFLVLVSVFLAACGHAQPSREDRVAALSIVNQSDLEVCEVHLAPIEQRIWGENQLEPEAPIAPNDGRLFYTRAGEYSVRLGDCRGTTLLVRRGLMVAGTRTVVFRPIGVQRHPRFGARRYAGTHRSQF